MLTMRMPVSTSGCMSEPGSSNLSIRRTIPPTSAISSIGGAANASARVGAPA